MKSIFRTVTAALATGSVWAANPTITVETTTSLGPVNRNLFGHNLEAGGDNPKCVRYGQGVWNPTEKRFNPRIISAIKELNGGMIRYPGGCMAHNYDWRKFVGPLEARPGREFGLDEFMQLCRELDAEPIITISDYVLPAGEMPAHAAALVEYLNAPAIPEHPWAMKRQEWGHPAPYGVKWFELGNESDHGNHGLKWGFEFRRYTPEQYVEYARATAAAMRQMDPTIKIGVVTKPGTGYDYNCRWNMEIYRRAVPIADFLVVHFYGPRVNGVLTADNFRVCMAYAEQLQDRLAHYRELCRQEGGKELPLAVTEYNVGHDTNQPTPYRFTYVAGLLCADMARLFLNPNEKIVNAEYWQVINGWWGLFETSGDTITRRHAAMPFYQLWGQHFAGQLLKTTVLNPPLCNAPSAGDQQAAQGSIRRGTEKITEVPIQMLKTSPGMVISPNHHVTFRLDGLTRESYPAFAEFSRPQTAIPGETWNYGLTCEARFVTTDPTLRQKISLGVGVNDRRGYGTTKSGAGIMGAEKQADWQRLSCTLAALPDCPGGTLLLKIEDGVQPYTGKLSVPVTGDLEVRNARVELYRSPLYPSYAGLNSAAALSDDGQTLHLIVFNKCYDQNIAAELDLKGFTARTAQAWTVRQDNVNSFDYAPPIRADLTIPDSGRLWQMTFPSHSMTAIDFHR